MVNNIILTLTSINDGINTAIYQEFIKNEQITTYNAKTIFLLNKNIFSLLLPNFGRVCGYPLYNNIMNFCYNNFIQSNEKLPLNHGLILNNGNFFINIKNISNNYLISNNKNFLINAKNALSTILWGNSPLNNNELEEDSLSLNNSVLNNIKNNCNLGDDNLKENTNTNLDYITTATSSSSSTSSLTEENSTTNVEYKIYNATVILSSTERVIRILFPSFSLDCTYNIEPFLIKNEELRRFFIEGPLTLENLFLYNVFEGLSNEEHYFRRIFFPQVFFSLEKSFITEYKVLAYFFNNKRIFFDNDIKMIEWFVKDSISKKIVELIEIRDVNVFKLTSDYQEAIKDYANKYDRDSLHFRNQISLEYDKKYETNFYTSYNDNLCKIEVLVKLRKYCIQ